MNKIEINAKLQYVFEGLPLSKVQKERRRFRGGGRYSRY